MENKIKHVGVVESVVGECVKVRVVQSSACASCKVAKQCNTSESKEKIIDIYTKDNCRRRIRQSDWLLPTGKTGECGCLLGRIFQKGAEDVEVYEYY